MTSPQLVLGLAAMAGGIAVGLSLVVGTAEERRAVDRSLKAITGGASSDGRATTVPFQTRVLVPALERFVRFGRWLTPQASLLRLTAQLDLAGNPAPWTLERLLAVKAVAAVVMPLLTVLLLSGGGLLRTALLATLAGAGAFYLPNLLVYNAGTKRQAEIQKTLPDCLDLLTVSVEAGMGFDAAISHVAKNTKGPVSGEFFRVLQEMQMKSRSDAFRSLGERTTVADLRTFVSALVQADALGIPIGRVLREQAKEMRLKRRQRAEEQAMKVPVKVLFPMVVFILPVLFMIVLAPAGMEIAATLKNG